MFGNRGASVSTKFTAILLLPLIAGLLLLGATVAAIVSGSAERGAITQAQEAARSLSNTLTALMKKALEDNPTIFGIWAVWEPNALDGQDSALAGKPGENNSGRYAACAAEWNRKVA